MYKPIIAVDFDGTLSLETRYPYIGKPNLKLFHYLLKAQRKGIGVVLWTCREGKELKEAIDWCRENGLEFDSVNENPSYVSFRSRKVVADLYIDDKALNPDKEEFKELL